MDKNIKDILNRPFDRTLIKERTTPGGRVLSYVALGHYISRLNEAFEDGGWSYEITESKILDEEAIVQVRLTAAGTIKMAIGGASITRRTDGKPAGLIHDLMVAESVAVKRACRLLGIGAALYLDEIDEQ
ncbi:MAG: Rad52/Rad22 family DNA repair protein, partial [Proteobacteria bacterium]|nr:Rad52/Rad22 family DNA repair protein [Pseudomonadota bacterium]